MKSNSNKLTASLLQLTFTFHKSLYLLEVFSEENVKDVKWEKEKLIGAYVISLPDCVSHKDNHSLFPLKKE